MKRNIVYIVAVRESNSRAVLGMARVKKSDAEKLGVPFYQTIEEAKSEVNRIKKDYAKRKAN